MKGITHRRIRLSVIAAVLVFAIVGAVIAGAVWDDSRAVHIDPRGIESSTLIIGTHLIHLSALNDSLYELAQTSAEESGQENIYYKSELGGNSWYNITTASSLTDITTGGTPVRDEEIRNLFLEYHTKSDKKTYDLRTGAAVNIFDIRDPYDLEYMDELYPLKLQYDNIHEGQGWNSTTDRIAEIWKTSIEYADTEDGTRLDKSELEKQLAALQAYLDLLNNRKADSQQTGKVSDVMAAVDAGRRYVVCVEVNDALQEYMEELNRALAEAGEEDEDEETQTPSTELISAVADSQGNLESSIITHAGKMLSQGVTATGIVEYELSRKLIDDAVAADYISCDADVQALVALQHILDNVISDRTQELALLDSRLLPLSMNRYISLMCQGASPEYRAEKANGAPQQVLDQLVKEYKNTLNGRRGEMEFLLEAKTMRLDAQAAMDAVDQMMESLSDAVADIPDDEFADAAADSMDSLTDALTDKNRALELSTGGNEMDKLTLQKEELQTQRLSALDKNDLLGAKAVDERLEEIEDRIRQIEAEFAAKMAQAQDRIDELAKALEADPENGTLKNELLNAEAEQKSLEKQLSDGSLGAMVAQLKGEALAGIKNGALGSGSGGATDGSAGDSGDGGASAIEALASLLSTDPALVLPALQEVHDALVLSGKNSALVDSLEQAILDNPNALSGGLSAKRIKQILADALGSSFGALGGDAAMKAVQALSEYCDITADAAAERLLASLAQRLLDGGDPRVFRRINDASGEYLPLTAVEAATGRRFVWNKNLSLGVLAKGSDYYGFTLYSTQVLRDRDGLQTEEMPRMAKNLAGIHIPEEYTQEAFGVWAVYLPGGELGCVCGENNSPEVQELLDLLLAG